MTRRSLLAWLSAFLPSGLIGGASQADEAGDMPLDKGERREPLFLSDADADRMIRDYSVLGGEARIDDAQIELLLSRLQDQIWPEATGGEAQPGASRFGGAPDLPPGAAWPVRPAMPERAHDAAATGGEDNWIARLFAEDVPYEFVAQIDLAEAAMAGEAASGLPAEGRLLFFVDSAVLMTSQRASADACRVIHDLSPAGALRPVAIPAKFDEMETWWRTVDPSEIARLNEMAESLEAAGQPEAAAAMREVAKASSDSDPASRKPFVYPSRAMKLTPLRVLPERGAIEVQLDDTLRALAEGDATFELYSMLTGNDIGPFSADPRDMTTTQPWSMQEARRNRFMGPPGAEQDDPRYAAIPASDLAPYPWDAEALTAMTGKAGQWCLLLQISVADLSQQQTEGTIYILLPRDDLARRDFTRAVAVYQQT